MTCRATLVWLPLAACNHEFLSMNDTQSGHQTGTASNADIWEFLRALLGNIILLLLLVGAERLFFQQGFYASLVQHPFWIIVLIAAVHDGLFVGVLIAVASTFLMDWPTRPAEVDITAHYIQVAILPLQWVLAALCIGLFRQAELRRAKAAVAEMARLQRVNEVLAADITTIEAQVTQTQLETLLQDEKPDLEEDLFSRILALQGTDAFNLALLFADVAELCTSLPASVLIKNTEGEFERLTASQANDHLGEKPRFNREQMQTLRAKAEIVAQRTAPFDRHPDFPFRVVVGVTSPDRRTLHGAVELLAPNLLAAQLAVNSARFLAIQLIPVLARLRMPAIAVPSDNALQDDRLRKRSHG